MIWAWVVRNRWLVGGAVGLLALAGIAWAVVAGVNHMLDQARAAGRAEVQAEWNAEKAGAATARAELSTALASAFTRLDWSLQGAVAKISADGRSIRVTVAKEMANEPRYTSADCALTDGVRAQVDAARRLSGPSGAATVHSGGLPTSGAAVRLDLGGPGDR